MVVAGVSTWNEGNVRVRQGLQGGLPVDITSAATRLGRYRAHRVYLEQLPQLDATIVEGFFHAVHLPFVRPTAVT